MPIPEEHFNAFYASPAGQALGEELCRELLACGQSRHVAADEMIFQEGDEAYGMFLIIEGLVKLVRYTVDGREIILHLAQPFRFIAEAALFLGNFPATAVATKPSEVILLRSEDMFNLMDRYPRFMRQIFDAMAIWLKRLVDKIDQLTLNDATARLAHYILHAISHDKDDRGYSSSTLTLPVKKGELARMLNMNQATLSRALRRLQDENVIEVHGRDFIISDMIRLQKASLPPLD